MKKWLTQPKSNLKTGNTYWVGNLYQSSFRGLEKRIEVFLLLFGVMSVTIIYFIFCCETNCILNLVV